MVSQDNHKPLSRLRRRPRPVTQHWGFPQRTFSRSATGHRIFYAQTLETVCKTNPLRRGAYTKPFDTIDVGGRLSGRGGLEEEEAMTHTLTEESMQALERFAELVKELQAAHDAGEETRYLQICDQMTELQSSDAYRNALARPV